MVSLTTVYLVSIVLTSIAGFGSVFASKKFVGGSETNVILPEPEEVQPTQPSVESPPLPSTEQIQPEGPLIPQ